MGVFVDCVCVGEGGKVVGVFVECVCVRVWVRRVGVGVFVECVCVCWRLGGCGGVCGLCVCG